MEKILIFGHQKPDTDSITSSICLSYLKNQLGYNTVPARLGNINDETKFVLNYFKEDVPCFIEDVKLQLKDLEYYKNCYVNKHDSIFNTYHYMVDKGITGVPVVDDDNKFLGLVTVKVIVKDIIDGNYNYIHTSYENILNTLDGEKIVKCSNEISGNILAAAYRSTTFMSSVKLEENNILIVGDRHSVIEYAIKSKVKLIIVVGNNEIKEEHILLAKENKVNIIRTSHDTFYTTKTIGLSNYVDTVIPNGRFITFNDDYYYDDFVVKTNKLKHNNYPIIGKRGTCKGLIRITDITNKKRKKVILVDHNEIEQSAEGLDEADILEIIDHHKIGNISTKNPINFRNMLVGSTNTIIYQMYLENGVKIPKNIAGLMLSGILSDTLALTSPTTTELDKKTVKELESITGLNYKEFSLEMFKEGTSLKNKTIDEIVNTDIKEFEIDDKKIAVSQIFTLDTDSIFSNKDEYVSYINKLSVDRNYKLALVVVTDILNSGSYLLYNESSADIISDAFDFLEVKEGIYIKNVVSRKKQIVPAIMEVIR